MSMHQILKIDECISFLTIRVERGEEYYYYHYYLCPIIDSFIIKKPYHVHLEMNQ